MDRQWKNFLAQIHETRDLAAAFALLEWDMQVNLPEKAAEGRGFQIESLAGTIHDKATSKPFLRLLDSLAGREFPPESFEAALYRQVRRDTDRQRKLPSRLVRALGAASSAGYGAWLKAREEDKFALFAPIWSGCSN